MKQNRVLHATTVHSANDIRIYHKECMSLAAHGLCVTLLARPNEQSLAGGIKHVPLRNYRTRFSRIILGNWDVLVFCLKNRFDVYHFHDPELVFSAFIIRLFGKSVIFDMHEDLSAQVLTKYWVPARARFLFCALGRAIEQMINIVSSRIVAATPAIAKKYNSHKVRVIQNYPILNELSLDDVEDSGRTAEKTVIYIGGISKARGAVQMLDAINLLSGEVTLVLAGKFESQELRTQCERHPAWMHVDFRGWISREEMALLLARAVAGLVLFQPAANHVNSQPNKLFEYMSAGLPVVGSSFPLWREVLVGNQCGIVVDPERPEDIAQAISQLMRDKHNARRMGMSGRLAVHEKYNWDIEAKNLVNVYEEFLV